MWATNKKIIILKIFFFCKGFVVSEKWPVQAAFIAAWISHFPSNYVYLIREKESQHHLVVIIERNVVVVLYLYCLGEQMKGKEVATELTAWASLITFQELTLKSQKKGENQKFFFDCQFEKVSRPMVWLKVFYLVTHSGCVQVITPSIIQLHWEQITRESSKVVGQLVILNFEKTCLTGRLHVLHLSTCFAFPAL